MAYPGLTELKSFMSVLTSGEDTNLTRSINAAIALFERACGRTFVSSAGTITFPVSPPYVTHNGYWLTLFQDLYSITSLTNGDNAVISSDDYILYPTQSPAAQIRLKSSSGVRFTAGGVGGLISVNGGWGYSADVPDDVNYAILRLAKHLFEASKQGAGGPVGGSARGSGLTIVPGGMPLDVADTIKYYRRLRL